MKKLIVLLLITVTVLLCLTVSVSATAPTGEVVSDEGRLPFEDVKDSHWFADALKFCYANGIIKGMNEYTFGFSGNLTRAQFVIMLAGLEDVDTSAYTVTKFTDVKSSHWWYGAIAWAYNEGIVSGMTETTFAPNGVLTRAQLATAMYNYMKDRYEVEVKDDALDSFTDKPKESYWYYDAMKYAVSAELISGNSNGTLDSTGKVTRAQAAVIFKNFMEKYFYGDCEHLFSEADCTDSAVCEACGLINGLPLGHRVSGYNCTDTAVCNVCEAEVAPSNIMHNFEAATCTAPRTCSACGVTRGSAKGHNWWAATCVNPKMCKVCYKTEGKALGHSWKNADCVNPKRCTRWGCGVTEGDAKGHSWIEADCINPKICSVCKLIGGDPLNGMKQHTWWEATCTSPKMCWGCYKKEGTALGHNWKSATCTSPKTCTRCLWKEGNANGHSWKNATCSAPKTCSACKLTEGYPLGHNPPVGTCGRCGISLPTSGYEAVVNVIKNKGFYLTSSNCYEMDIEQGTGSITQVFYYVDDDCIVLNNNTYYNYEHMDHIDINIKKGSSVCDYRYSFAYHQEYIFEGYGMINMATFTKSTKEGFSKYTGNLKSEYTDYMNTALKVVLDDTNTILKPYNLSVKDLGFKVY